MMGIPGALVMRPLYPIYNAHRIASHRIVTHGNRFGLANGSALDCTAGLRLFMHLLYVHLEVAYSLGWQRGWQYSRATRVGHHLEPGE